MNRAELNADPIQGEFFTPQGITSSLVRESIQNSLDARAGSHRGPVQVRFSFSLSGRQLSPGQAAPYWVGLRPHLEAQRELEEIPSATDPTPFLCIEDFGTRGLGGDPEQAADQADPGDRERNDFFYFWRNVGRSGKAGDDRGRWGLGKTVFPAMSLVNAFFGLTVREEDGRGLLLGQAMLKIHQFGGKRFAPYGFFSPFSDEDGFPDPCSDPDALTAFSEAFDLNRRGDPGLSIVVPHPLPTVEPEEVVREVIQQYFYPILTEELTVDVTAPGLDCRIAADSIDEVTSDLVWGREHRVDHEALSGLYELARWSREVPDEERVELERAGVSGAPTWTDGLFPEGVLDELRARFIRGGRIALHVPMQVQRKGESPSNTAFDVYLERDTSLPKSQENYVRQGITITGIQRVRERSLRGLVVVNDKTLSRLLGDAENPAHTDWQERADRVRRGYIQGQSRVRFVRSSLKELCVLLGKPSAGKDFDLLSHIFYLPVAEGDQPSRRRKRKRGKGPVDPPDIPEVPRPPKAFDIERREGGFRICGNPSAPNPPERLIVRAAYETRHGNAFKAYDPLDFQVHRSPISVTVEGANIAKAENNRLELNILVPEFELTVVGFDNRRDLRVDARAGATSS